MMHLILWVIAGLLAGALAKRAVPDNPLVSSRGPWGLLGDLILGLIGAVTGGWLFQNAPGHGEDGWMGSTIVAFIGAVIVLLSLRFAIGGRTA
jgi:uncharacterized membrane protein YeaQ/YmgE (transglycosylase-associated protein family)